MIDGLRVEVAANDLRTLGDPARPDVLTSAGRRPVPASPAIFVYCYFCQTGITI